MKKMACVFLGVVISCAPFVVSAARINPKSVCLGITHNLGFNKTDAQTGGDVSKLQRFLAQDRSVYPEGRITGTFGPATALALFKWQGKEGIILPEDPDHVGGGILGPKTRKALDKLCKGRSIARPLDDRLWADDDSGRAPFDVIFNYYVNRAGSCGAGSYSLSFGDGTKPVTTPYRAGVCNPFKMETSHTYATSGTYTATLTDEDGVSIKTQVVTVTK
jgi:hypothetical protein